MSLSIPCLGLILGAGGLVFPAAYFRLVAHRGLAWNALWVMLAGVWSVATGYAIYFAAPAVSLFGACLCSLPILALFVGGIAIVVSYQPYVLLMGDHPEDRRAAGRYRRMSLICVPVLLALQVAPLPVASGLLERCNAEHREMVERLLVPALEAYRRDHGEYPTYHMQELVPDYLAAEPWVACAAPARTDAGHRSSDSNHLGDFSLDECYYGREGDHFIYYADMDAQVYNLSTRTWSSFDPYDGPVWAACRLSR